MSVGRGGEKGQGLVEYGLILFLVATVGLIGVTVFGGGVGAWWSSMAAQVVALI